MLKKTMVYNDFNGVERKETFFFNLTKQEVAEMELSIDGGLMEKIKRIIDAKDGKEIVGLFKEIILSAYGEKSDDGRHFIKSEEIRNNFASTQAFSDLYMELFMEPKAAAAFIEAVIPPVDEKEVTDKVLTAVAPPPKRKDLAEGE